jgi:DNA-binding transcriptional ArsR family regulator
MLMSQTFKALGDPIRLEIIERLASGSTFTLGDVSKDLGLTRQGARKHLQVLADAHLITLNPNGRQTLIAFEPGPVKIAASYMGMLELKWEERLEALKNFVESTSPHGK